MFFERPEPKRHSPEIVSLSFTVKDSAGRYVTGLKPSDVRVFEDGILQTVDALREGHGSLTRAEGERLAKPRFVLRVRDEDADDAYTVTYSPEPANHNQTYRSLRVQILRSGVEHWTIRHTPGYWHDAPQE